MLSPSDTDDRDLTQADRDELEGLMQKHADAVPAVLRQILVDEAITPLPDDSGPLGWLAQQNARHPSSATKMVSKRGLWRSLLEALRERDGGEGVAR